MQLLLGILLPLVLANDTGGDNNTTSTLSEKTATTGYSESTKAYRHHDGTFDGPVLLGGGQVHKQGLENVAAGIRSESEKLNNGELQQETTEMPVVDRSIHQTEEKPPIEIHQLHQITRAAETATKTEETMIHQKTDHQESVLDFHQKAEVEDESRPPSKLQHSFEVDEDGRAHLPVDPFSLHHPFLHTSVAEFEYSQWYLLLFTPSNASLLISNTENLPNQLTRSLAEKLEVSSSTFHISNIDSNREGSLSANISLARLTVPHLHRNLCNLPQDGPTFEFDGRKFTLVTVRHDKNQHLYIRTNPSSTTTGDELGLLLTVTLGGLGMFLLVMAFSFLAAQIVSKQDISGVSDLEDILVEHREGSLDSCDVLEKEIFIIDNSDEPDTYNDEGFCRENGCLTEASKEEMRRWNDDGREGRMSGSRRFGRLGLGTRLERSWRELWQSRLIDID